MDGSMKRRRITGNATSSLLLLLVALLGLGAWNYYRNYQLERASQRGRPYSGYSTHEVELLRDAVAAELEADRARFERARSRRVRSARDQGSVGDNARQFNRTARASDAIRDAAGDVAAQESLKAALDQELAARAGDRSGTALHLKRLTTF